MYFTPAVYIPGVVSHKTERDAIEYARLNKTYAYRGEEPRIYVVDFRPSECYGNHVYGTDCRGTPHGYRC